MSALSRHGIVGSILTVRWAWGLLAFAMLTSPTIQAQDARPHRRSGFTLGFSLGQGSMDYRCSGGPGSASPGTPCGSDGRAGVGLGHLTLGWTLTPSVVVGLSTDGWKRQGLNENGSVHSLSLHVYPSERSGFFVTAGAGRSSSYIGHGEYLPDVGRGWGAVAGLGVDIPVDEGYSLMLQVRTVYADQGDVGSQFVFGQGRITSEPIRTNVHQFVVGISLGLRFH